MVVSCGLTAQPSYRSRPGNCRRRRLDAGTAPIERGRRPMAKAGFVAPTAPYVMAGLPMSACRYYSGSLLTSYLTLATVAIAVVLAVVLVLTRPKSGQIAEWLVGAAAGLDFAQIGHVHLFTIMVAFWLLASRTTPWHRVSPMLLTLLLSAGLLAATSFTGPLAVNHTLSLQLMALATTAAIIALKATPDSLRRMAKGLLAVCLFSASYAILQKAGILPLRAFNAVEGTGRVMGIYREPDWLGLFCAVGIVVVLQIDELTRLRKIMFLLVLGLALVFSLARASIVALGALAIISIFVNILSGTSARRSRNRQVLVAVGCLATVSLALNSSLASRLINRFETGFSANGQDVGAQARTQQVRSLNVLAKRSPWYGDGFSAAGRVQVNGQIIYGPAPPADAVSTDWVLGWWVDGKYLALPLIALFCIWIMRSIKGLGGRLLLIVLVTSLVSDAVMLPITWFCVAACLVRPPVATAEPATRNPEALSLDLATA